MPVYFRLILLLVSLSCWTGAHAQAPAAPAAAHAAASARLKVGVRTVFVFRSALGGYPAQERADGARKRLDKALALGGP